MSYRREFLLVISLQTAPDLLAQILISEGGLGLVVLVSVPMYYKKYLNVINITLLLFTEHISSMATSVLDSSGRVYRDELSVRRVGVR